MKNTLLWTRCFSYIWFVSISRILFPISKVIDIYLGCKLLHTSSDSSIKTFLRKIIMDTILHTCKDLAVSLFNFVFTNLYKDLSITYDLDTILFRVNSVSARTSVITHDGYYPLHFLKFLLDMCSDFPHLAVKRTHLSEYKPELLYQNYKNLTIAYKSDILCLVSKEFQ